MNLFWYDWAGYLGTALILLAYLLLQVHKLSGTGLVYQSMNVLGALGLVLSLAFSPVPLVWSELLFALVWLLIGVLGIVHAQRRRRALRSPMGGSALPPM